jgi:Flp pilus assembly protein TadD
VSDPSTAQARALYREGFQHFAAGRLAEAVACYRRALAAAPRLAIAWNGLSMALARSGDLDGAIEAGQKLVALEPDEPLNHTNLSILYQSRGMVPEAEEEKAIAMQLEMKAKRHA